jgi:transposase-like protein
MKRRRKIKKQFKALMDLTTKKGKVLKKIFGELNKKRWSCKQCEELLLIIKNPSLRNGTKKGMKRKTARLAYMNGRKNGKNTRAKEAMKIHHSEGVSLREAWRRV